MYDVLPFIYIILIYYHKEVQIYVSHIEKKGNDKLKTYSKWLPI